MNIMILVNKDFEYAGYREGVEHRITSKKIPHLYITGRRAGTIYNFFNPSCEYDLVTDTGTHKIREFCISYLFEEKDNSSNSEIKYGHLQKLISTEKPDYIISVSTSESTAEMQNNGPVNGCVIMGTKFYAKDCRDYDKPKPASHLTVTTYAENDPPFYNFYNLINANQQVLTDGMRAVKNYSANTLSCITDPKYVSLGVVNITNYACYKDADPATYEDFINAAEYKGLIPEGLETTHTVVKKAAKEAVTGKDIPVLFVSPIVDRYERFDDDVDGKWGEQNRSSSFNAGVVVANMLEYFRNELCITSNEATEVKLSAIKKGMFVHCEVTTQTCGACHVRLVDGTNDKFMEFNKLSDSKNSQLVVVEESSKTTLKETESSDVKIIFLTDDSKPHKCKVLKSFNEIKDENNELKAIVYSIHLEDAKDYDYNDISINITAWKSKG